MSAATFDGPEETTQPAPPPRYKAPVHRCTAATHEDLKADVDVFLAHTKGHQPWAGLLTAECRACESTLALYLCVICTKPCPSEDCLPIPHREDEHGHFACVAQKALATGQTKFVIVVGGGKAREFAR